MEKHNKSPRFVVRQQEPFNGGSPADELRQQLITPYESFYVRSHAPQVPVIDADAFRLIVEGQVAVPLSLSLDDLKRDFEQVTLDSTLQCAGNRRIELYNVSPMPGESVMWKDEAISTATWRGVRLCDVLAKAGARGAHVAFLSLDECERDGEIFGYGSSIPMQKAAQPEALLVYEMNGAPLPPVHGYPLRVVVPGYIAARSVKWLGKITVQDMPSDNYYQARDYKLFPPEISGEGDVDWDAGEMLGPLRTDALISTPAEGDVIAAGEVLLQGYAIPADEALITRVEISTDDGATWSDATLTTTPAPYVWCFWEARAVLTAGEHALRVRAHDTLGTVQPVSAEVAWNFRGYMNNSVHRVVVQVK